MKKLYVLTIFIGFVGVWLRFLNITQPDFVLYDEGYYLNYTRGIVEFIANNPPHGFEESWNAFCVIVSTSLATGKALWFLIIDSRVFFGGAHMWFFPRVASAVAGALTLILIYFFAKRLYQSREVGLLSVIILAILPSHIFYSKIGIQEALSVFLFLLAFYFYLFPRSFGPRTFLSGFLFGCVYFTNYRLVIIPVLTAFTEIYFTLTGKKALNFRKYLWHTLTFSALVILIANADQGQNAQVTYAWMFHQAELAKTEFDWMNSLSYPYYVLNLESFLFGIAFFANLYFLIRREWAKGFAFALVAVLMFIFTFTQDKAARYLAIGLPFMTMSVAGILVDFWQNQKNREAGNGIIFVSAIIFLSLLPKSFMLAKTSSDYRPAIEHLTAQNPDVKVLSTQPWVQNLFTKKASQVVAVPHQFAKLAELYGQGYHYLILDPQAYISYTESKRKFDPSLGDYLGFIATSVEPVKTFQHFNRFTLERFVFEHNEDLRQSLKFLRGNREELGALKIYDIKQCLETIARRLSSQNRHE